MIEIGVFWGEFSGRVCNLGCSKDVAYFVNGKKNLSILKIMDRGEFATYYYCRCVFISSSLYVYYGSSSTSAIRACGWLREDSHMSMTEQRVISSNHTINTCLLSRVPHSKLGRVFPTLQIILWNLKCCSLIGRIIAQCDNAQYMFFEYLCIQPVKELPKHFEKR